MLAAVPLYLLFFHLVMEKQQIQRYSCKHSEPPHLMEVTGQLHAPAALNLRKAPPVLTEKEAGHFRKTLVPCWESNYDSSCLRARAYVCVCVCARTHTHTHIHTHTYTHTHTNTHRIISIQNTVKSCILYLLELPTTGAAICRQIVSYVLNYYFKLTYRPIPSRKQQQIQRSWSKKNAHSCRHNVNVTHRTESQLMDVAEGVLSPEPSIHNTHCFEYHIFFLRSAFL